MKKSLLLLSALLAAFAATPALADETRHRSAVRVRC